MIKIGTVAVGTESLNVFRTEYNTSGLAIVLKDQKGYPYATLSYNLPDTPLGKDEFLAKTVRENEVLREPLLRSGLFEDTGRRGPAPWDDLEVWQLGGECPF